MSPTRVASFSLLLCAACGGDPTAMASGSDTGSGSGSGSDADAGTTGSDPGTTEAPPGLDSTTGTTGLDSTGGSSTTSEDETGSTGEPPHVTNFDLCEIDVQCDLPIVDEPKRNCHLTVTEGDGYVVYDGPAGFENRGRSSQGWPKHQYSVELWLTPNVELVAPGSTWRYNDGPSAGGADWMSPSFDDSGWAEGPAPLGYGISGPEWTRGGQPWATVAQIPHATTIGFGPDPFNKYITSWYRQDFEVADAATLQPVKVNLRSDDGVVVYINGTEVVRHNMPEGVIGPGTTALGAVASLSEVEFVGFPVDPTVFVDGTNVVAVEIHQAGGTSSDVVMDLALSTSPPEASRNFFEFGAESDWVFNGAYFDLSLYRNKLAYDLFDSFAPTNNYGPQGHYCELTLNGDWHGIFTLGEKVKRDDDRVDIQSEMGTGESFIFKSDITQQWIFTNGVGWQLEYPKVENLNPASTMALEDFMNDFAAANAGVGSVWDYVELASVVDWVLLQEFARNGDAYYSSMHIYKDIGGKIEFVPWDFDLGMSGGCTDATGWIGRSDTHWLNTITEDPGFRDAFVWRWNDLRQTVLSEASIEAQIDGYVATMTAEKITQNFERWPMDQIIGGDDWVLLFRENCPVQTWDEEDARVRQWILDRLAWMDANIETFD